jgi:hypothetical protein
MPSFSKYASVTLNAAGGEQVAKQLWGSIMNNRRHPPPDQEKGGNPMSSNASMYARQYHAESADHGYPESRFSRLPWDRIEHRQPDGAPVTLWVGVSRIIVAVELQDIEPNTLSVSVKGNSLMFREAGRLDFSLDVPLPCAVEVNPVILTKGKDILCVLLMKKQEAVPVTAEGYGDRDLPVPVLTMDGTQEQRKGNQAGW